MCYCVFALGTGHFGHINIMKLLIIAYIQLESCLLLNAHLKE